MPLIEHARRALRLSAVARVLTHAGAGVDRLRRIVDQMRPCIRRRQAQPSREPVLKARLQRMIDSVSVGRDHANSRVALVWTPRLNVAWAGLGLIEVVEAGIDMRAFAAHPS